MARPEIEMLEHVHRAAIARLGLAIGILARDEWQTVNPLNPNLSRAEQRIWRLILGGRQMSRRLSELYLRLIRALEIGETYAGSTGPAVTSLDELREQYLALVTEVLEFAFSITPDMDIDEQWLADLLRDAEDDETHPRAELEDAIAGWLTERGPDGRLRIRDFVWPQDQVETLDDAARVYGNSIRAAGPDGLQHKLNELARKHADDADRFRREAAAEFEKHGNMLAAEVDKAGIDAGRDFIMEAVQKDSRRSSMTVARGTRANPCAFCAMLASRGFVYLSARTAMHGYSMQAYHPNCHCFPILRWKTDTLPERNEYFQEKWAEVTRGHSGREARKVWRRWINAERRTKRSGG
ncbi:hypothetical protein [Brevibacterium album]|uniref:VG15 protein n=1 Tax=Brevibacterium album TaxID=417948 RepID=UPI000427833B|nr:hypothetical protein [Brevibacterium album]